MCVRPPDVTVCGRLLIIALRPVTKLRGPAAYHSRDWNMLCHSPLAPCASKRVLLAPPAHRALHKPTPHSLVPLAALVPPLPPPSLVPLAALAPPLPPPPLVALAPEPVVPPTPGSDAAACIQPPPDAAPRTR